MLFVDWDSPTWSLVPERDSTPLMERSSLSRSLGGVLEKSRYKEKVSDVLKERRQVRRRNSSNKKGFQQVLWGF